MAELPKKQYPPHVGGLFFQGTDNMEVDMKKTAIVIIALSAFFLGTSFFSPVKTYGENLLFASLDHDSHESKTLKEKEEIPYSLCYNGTVGGQFVIHEKARGDGTVFQREPLNLPFSSEAKSIHQPLVYWSPDFYTPVTGKINKSSVLDLEFSSIIDGARQGEAVQITAAFLTTFAAHELGHAVVADYVGAGGARMNFLTTQNGNFFLGSTTYNRLNDDEKLPLSMGGAVASDITFEHALQSYRKNPNMYNKSLLFFSGVDFLWYSAYAFYLSDGNSYYDPVAVSEHSGLSKNTIFTVALAKVVMNAYRVYSGQDRVIPYFTVDKTSAVLNIGIIF